MRPLLVLFRSRLEWCNFTCHYCPWNATLNRTEADAFRDDAARVHHVIDRVAELSRPVEFFVRNAQFLFRKEGRDHLRNAACKSLMMAPDVAPASGNRGLITCPLIAGGDPAQSPKPPVASIGTELHMAPVTGCRTTFPLIVVIGTVGVLVTPALAAIAKGAANPRLGGSGKHD